MQWCDIHSDVICVWIPSVLLSLFIDVLLFVFVFLFYRCVWWWYLKWY